MKRAVIGFGVVVAVGVVGYMSFSLVKFGKAITSKEISTPKVENAKSPGSEYLESEEKEGEISDENSLDDVPNRGANPTSDDLRPISDSTNNDEYLDFSSADSFILSYNNLINNVGSSVTKQDTFSSASKAWLVNTKVGNLSIFSYQFDDSLKEIYIIGEDRVSEISRVLDGKANVKFENGDTVIYNIMYNDN